ncbi:hypothetical protein GIS00_26015 [Nakamurella sp. YIM 132087]|uniref:Twin-arginine translocation signal domain-containing protein n=1 Tax=Nakamurella alba TaxID=2665158 RepID=A0A7K1FTA9_9ACTN|nr:hypothetical protein [Nakamurella alba]MTD17392.1 hypothetical protein [Nakamurella alba]
MSFTETVVNKLATGWRSRRADRRSFLAGAAVVGSAVATSPWRWATTPISAYDAVCGEGALCEQGWSVFCCSINAGANQCPPGSFVAGWWKADNSGFCCGSARYYIDCNAMCGSDWQCRCGSGSCDQRRVACNQFRYGQCHQEIACYGPVVCRVVTCTPPWQFDASCTATSLTDNRTVTHSAPCLPGNCPSELTKFYYDRGGPGGRYGPVTAPERNSAAGGRVMTTRGALIYQLRTGGVQVATGAVLAKYRALEGSRGPLGEISAPMSTATDGGTTATVATFQHGMIVAAPGWTRAIRGTVYDHWRRMGGFRLLGFPMEDQAVAGTGIRQLFQRGVIYDFPGYPPFLVNNHYLSLYREMGYAGGLLGAPRSDEVRPTDGRQYYTTFEKGRMYWTPERGAVALLQPLFDAWKATGAERGPLGYPTGVQKRYPNGSHAMAFQKGNLYYTKAHGAHMIFEPFLAKWRNTGSTVHSRLGLPITDRVDRSGSSRVTTEHGAMVSSAAYGVHLVYGPIYKVWQAAGAEGGRFGLPRTDVFAVGDRTRCDFQGGILVYDPATGKVSEL